MFKVSSAKQKFECLKVFANNNRSGVPAKHNGHRMKLAEWLGALQIALCKCHIISL